MDFPLVTVCIVNYNGKEYLDDCFTSIYNTDYPKEKIEVILADNASTDGSLDLIRDKYHGVKMLALEKNYGFAKANNLCAEAAQGKYIVFLNNDTSVTRDWLKPLVTALSSDDNIGIVGSKLMLMGDDEKINSAGGRILSWGGGYDVGFSDKDSESYSIRDYRGCVCGASMMVRKDEFIKIGMFDEGYFMYFEDIDLCWRCWLYGKKVMYIPESIVYHKVRGTSGKDKDNLIRAYQCTRNPLFNMAKNYELQNLLLFFGIFFIYNSIKFAWFAVRLKYKQAVLVIMAYYTFIVTLPDTMRKRRLIQSMRKVNDKYLFKMGIIEYPLDTLNEVIRLWKTKTS